MSIITLKNKVALVTGSARRVGKSIALELARQGMNLVVHHNSSGDDEAAETAAEIRALGVDVLITKADQSKAHDVRRMFDAVRQHYGRLDLLVNSASILNKGEILDITLQDWQTTLDINLTGPFLCSQQAARLMRETGIYGSIVNITDMSAFKPWKGFGTHSVSKAGLVMLTEVFAVSLAPDIRVNAIAPGPVLRDDGNSPEAWQRIGERLPLRHSGDPQDVADAVVYLATQPFVTGVTLPVNGGEHLI